MEGRYENLTPDWLAEAVRMGYNPELEQLRKNIEMKKREEILSNHKFAITQVKEMKRGCEIIRWRTNLPDENGKKGKLVKKSTREALENYLIDFYKQREQAEIPTFDSVYHEWVEHHIQLNNLSKNTIDKYQTDYLRFIKDSSIAEMHIEKITDANLEDYFLDCIRSYVGKHGEKGLEFKPFTKLFGYINGVFKYAFKRRIIRENPMIYLESSDFRNACREPKEKTAETELIPGNLHDMLLAQLYKDMKRKPTNFTFYAVELCSLTGMRVSEAATLQWSDINHETGLIYICRSDKYHKDRDADGKITRRYFTIEGTKTKKNRYFPITEQIDNCLNRIKKAQMQYDCVSDFLFPHEKYGWCHNHMISSCIKNKCKQLGFDRTYGIHALRKTLNSDLRNDNAPDKMCSAMIGNTVEVNNKHYYFDNSTTEEKKQFVERAQSKRAYA